MIIIYHYNTICIWFLSVPHYQYPVMFVCWTRLDRWLGSSVGRPPRQYWKSLDFKSRFGYCVFSPSHYICDKPYGKFLLFRFSKKKLPAYWVPYLMEIQVLCQRFVFTWQAGKLLENMYYLNSILIYVVRCCNIFLFYINGYK